MDYTKLDHARLQHLIALLGVSFGVLQYKGTESYEQDRLHEPLIEMELRANPPPGGNPNRIDPAWLPSLYENIESLDYYVMDQSISRRLARPYEERLALRLVQKERKP